MIRVIVQGIVLVSLISGGSVPVFGQTTLPRPALEFVGGADLDLYGQGRDRPQGEPARALRFTSRAQAGVRVADVFDARLILALDHYSNDTPGVGDTARGLGFVVGVLGWPGAAVRGYVDAGVEHWNLYHQVDGVGTQEGFHVVVQAGVEHGIGRVLLRPHLRFSQHLGGTRLSRGGPNYLHQVVTLGVGWLVRSGSSSDDSQRWRSAPSYRDQWSVRLVGMGNYALRLNSEDPGGGRSELAFDVSPEVSVVDGVSATLRAGYVRLGAAPGADRGGRPSTQTLFGVGALYHFESSTARPFLGGRFALFREQFLSFDVSQTRFEVPLGVDFASGSTQGAILRLELTYRYVIHHDEELQDVLVDFNDDYRHGVLIRVGLGFWRAPT